MSAVLLFGQWHALRFRDRAVVRGSQRSVEDARHLPWIGENDETLLVSVPSEVAGGAPRCAVETERVPHPRIPEPVDGIDGIVAAFKEHPVVMIGECHWLQQAGDFYIRLVRNREFQETVQDIVVEFASRQSQPLVNRYVAGEEISVEEVRRIWRDTTKVAGWESPIYARWLEAIREANRGLPPSRRLRVLAGDTAIDWPRMRTHSDWLALGDNNTSFADVISEEVLKKKRRALVVLGMNHVVRPGDRNETEDTTTRVESRYPGSTYVALILCGNSVTRAAQDLLSLPNLTSPMLFQLAAKSYGRETGRVQLPMVTKADALLYLGPPEAMTLVPPSVGTLEPSYLREVDRRSIIEWGELRAREFLGPAAH